MRRRSKKPLIIGTFVASFVFGILTAAFKPSTEPADAASLANFKPGNIISDYVMSNYSSMTEAEIQAFLTSKNSCNNKNYSDYQYYTATYPNNSWHWKDGHFVCLSEERFGNGETIGSGETAAHIIWQAAQDYKINPQVLLVLLQKEQGLITDTYPNSRQYRAATGYGCPDTAACSEKYYGFKNQIRNAASLFRTVLNGGWTNYPLGNNYIQYSPDSNCGGSVVNIENLATSALYRYTPYQPNAGALAAGYGTATCGAYGNRNFYLYFMDWFGNPNIAISNDKSLEGTYTIFYSGNKNKAVGISKSSTSENANVEISSYDINNTSQKWQFKLSQNGEYYTIINQKSGKALDVSGGIYKNKNNIWQHTINGDCAQRWQISKNKDSSYTIYNYCHSSYTLDLQDGISNIQLYTKTDYDNDHQKWILQKV